MQLNSKIENTTLVQHSQTFTCATNLKPKLDEKGTVTVVISVILFTGTWVQSMHAEERIW